MAGNEVVEVPTTSALQAIDHSPDLTSPTLEYFTFDLGEGLLLLTFSESVNVSSFNTSLFTIANGVNSLLPSYVDHTLTGGIVSVNDTELGLSQGIADHDVVVKLMLSDEDLNAIKALTTLATQRIDTRLFFEYGAVFDSGGNAIEAVSPTDSYVALEFFNDTMSPELLAFDLNLNDGVIVLTFSETVNAASLNFTEIMLTDHNINTTMIYPLSGGTVTSGDGTEITFNMSRQDIDYIKVVPDFFSRRRDSYIFVDSGAIVDNSGNSILPIPLMMAIRVSRVVRDTTDPELESANLDLNNGSLTLVFSESVLVSSLNVSMLTISNGQPGTENFTLTSSSQTQSSDGAIIVIEISREDLNAIKSITTLAVSQSSSFISYTSGLINDTSRNQVFAIDPENATMVNVYTPDTTRPELEGFDLALTDGVRRPLLLIVQFTESIDVSTVDVTGFTFQAEQDASLLTVARHTLTGGNVTQIADDTIEIAVLDMDFESIIAIPGFLRSTSATFLSVTGDSVRDTSGYGLVAIGTSEGLTVRSYDVDLVSPSLSAFSLDMDTGVLSLTWSENVLLETLMEYLIVIQNGIMQGTSYHRLGNASSISYGANQSIIDIEISDSDLNRIKSDYFLATSINDTYLAVLTDDVFVFDFASNPSEGIPITNAQQVAAYTPDETRPILTSFDIMLSTRVLTLYFSESMNPDSLDPLGITLQNRNRQATESVMLTGGSTSSPPGTVIEVNITNDDLNSVKVFQDLFTSSNNSYLAIASYAITDTAGNPIITVPPSAALQVDSFENDTRSPVFIGFNLNLDSRILSLSFSETVNASTLNITGLTLSDDQELSMSNIEYTLVSSSAEEVNGPVVNVRLSDEDFHEITRLELCLRMLECYLNIEEGTVLDMSGLEVETTSLPVDILQPDESSPQVLEFVSFNLREGTLNISFTETIDASSINFTALTFQSLYEDPLETYTLTGGSASSDDGTLIQLTLSDEDLVAIKERQNLCVTQSSCYITFSSYLITDKAATPNSIVEQLSGEAPGLIAMEFTEDDMPPTLISFIFDAANGRIILSFDEPVDVGRFDPSGIHIQDAQNSTTFYTLTGGSAGTISTDVVTFTLSTRDLNAIRALPYAKNTSNTYISIDPFAIQDISFISNFIVAIPMEDALQATNYTNDETRPTIVAFSLDLDRDLLVLTFSESVQISSLDVAVITLIGNESIPESFVPLTGGIVSPLPPTLDPGSVVIQVELNQPDIVAIKTNPYLATSEATTCLRAGEQVALDTAGLPSIGVDFTCAEDLTMDSTRVRLTSYTLDVNIGTIELTFNDVVDAATFNVEALTIQDDVYSTAANRYSLTSSSSATNISGYYINITIGPVDLFRLKSTPNVATSLETSYLSFYASAVDDPYGVDVLAITNGKALQATNFTADTDPPEFVSFDLDLNSNTLHLSFSEAIDLSSLETDQLTLYSENITTSNDVSSYNLTGGTLEQSEDGKVITLYLTEEDMNNIKANTELATSENNTFLEIPSGILQDAVGNNFTADQADIAYPVLRFIPDEVAPMLTAFVLDINNGWLNLTFSETVMLNSIDVTQITIQNRRTANDFTDMYTLQSSEAVGTNSPQIYIILSADDLNSLKITRRLAIDMESAYISVTSNLTLDMNNNPVENIPASGGLVSSDLIEDTTRPQLLNFTFSRIPGTLYLTFDEVIDYEVFDYTQITVVNDSSTVDNLFYTLQLTGTIAPATVPYRPIYSVQPEDADVNNIKRILGLATNTNNTYLLLTNQTTHDYAANLIIGIEDGDALQASDVVEDDTPPRLTSFLFDANTGILTLIFDEVVLASSLNVTQIRLVDFIVPMTEYFLTSGTVILENDLMLTVSLTEEDQNAIKVDRLLATSENNTYIDLADNTVYDTAGNGITELMMPQRVASYMFDVTRPTLLSWNISINEGEVYLLFSEAMDHFSLNPTLMRFQNNETLLDETQSYYLTVNSFTDTPDGIRLVVTLSRRDLDALKDLTELVTGVDDSFLSFTRTFVNDMAGNRIYMVRQDDARQAEFTFEDITRPQLERFDFFLNESLLVLYFSETVNPTNINITDITLQNAPNSPTRSFQITSSSSYLRTDYSIVEVRLNLSDLNTIKSYNNLGTYENDTYISILSTLAEDRNDNPVVPIIVNSALRVSEFRFDNIPPELVSFRIDFSYGNITLSFTETVNISSLDLTQIIILDQPTTELNVNTSYNLTGGILQDVTTSRDVIEFELLKEDRDEITRLPDLCTGAENCYIAITEFLVTDTMDNPVVAIPHEVAQMPLEYVPDTISTFLTEFVEIDLDSGVLKLLFEEVIDASTIDVTSLRLQDFPASSLSSVMLSGGEVISSNSTQVVIQMTNDDLNLVKAATGLCTVSINCNVRLLTTFASDTFGNPISPVENDPMNSVTPTNHVPDTNPPSLVAWDIDLTNENVTLYFNETVNYIVFRSRYITLLNTEANATQMLRLQNDIEHTEQNLPYIQFTLVDSPDFTDSDVVAIKALEDLVTSRNNSFISFTSQLVSDTSGNSIIAVNEDEAQQVRDFNRDSESPMLTSFNSLDMNRGVFVLAFDEPVNISTVLFDQIALHNDNIGGGTFQLTGGNVTYTSATKEEIEIRFSDADLRQIKLRQDLATSDATSYVSFANGAVLDMAGNAEERGNPVISIPSSTPEQVVAGGFVQDVTSPVVLAFELDMDSAELTLTFDDVVDVSTLNARFITFQNNQFTLDPIDSFQLTGGSSNSSDAYTIIIDITDGDLNEIKMRDNLATNINNTFLSLRAATIREVAGSAVDPILDDDAQQVVNFIPDTTKPFLERYSIDLNLEVLVLVFSEAVNVTSLDLTQINLQNTPNISDSTETYTLTGGIKSPPVTGVTVTVQLTKFDLDNLKALTMLGTNVNDTYLFLTMTTVLDQNTNSIVPISSSSAQMAFSLEADIIPPTLVQWCLDLDGTAFIELTFSETVNVSSLDPALISLQNVPMLPSSEYTLTGGNVTSDDEIVVQVYLTTEDSNAIKRLRDLASSSGDAYLRFERGMISDNNARNPIAQVSSANAIQVNTTCYTFDTTPPELISFDLNVSNDTLTLYFSETVSTREFNFTGITLLGAQNRFSPQRTLTDGTLLSQDSHIITLMLAFDDANFIKNESRLATSEENTYIVLDEMTLIDINSNPIQTIQAADALQVDAFTNDTQNPQLVAFNFDLNLGELTFSFTETVDVASLDVTQVNLHDELMLQHTLSNMSFSVSPNGPVVLVSISDDDLNRIKQITTLATNESNTFITFSELLIYDTSMNEIEAVTIPYQVRRFDQDRTEPELVSFRLDMANTVPPLLLVLTFSETVRADSVDPTQFELRAIADVSNSTTAYNLTGGNVSSINSTEITITVTNDDLEAIRLLQPLGFTVETSYLAFTELALLDMADLRVVPISTPARQATRNDADIVPPTLEQFSFDLNSGTIILTFSENVTLFSLVIPRITLQNDDMMPYESLTFSENTTALQLSGSEIRLSLTPEELNELKQMTNLGIDEFTTFISLEPNVINDVAENDALPVLNTSALMVTEYTRDTTRPSLNGFDLNLKTRELTLYFSETVNSSSVNPFGILLVNAVDGDTRYRLTGGDVVSEDGPVIVLVITITDKNGIKAAEDLATSNDSTYIAIRPAAIRDNAGNRVNAITARNAIPVTNFTPDAERPSLLSFDLDMDMGILLLYFNETVNVSTLFVDRFTLQDNTTLDRINHTLTSSTVQNDNTATVQITISRFDLNEIKRKQFCYSSDTCFLTFEDDAVRDMVNISIDGVPDGQAIQVDNFVNDSTSPAIAEFTQIDLAHGFIVISFTETINVSSLNFDTITFMDLFETNLANFTLTGGFTNDSDGDVITIYLLPEDLRMLQANSFLCTQRGNCYIRFTSDFIMDMVGNPVEAVPSEPPGFIVRTFGQDIFDPELLSFSLNLNEGVLSLSFNEPVRASSLDPTGIIIQGEINTTNPALVHRLTGGETFSGDMPVININLTIADLNALKASIFAKDTNTTFIAIEATTITDNAFTPNQVDPIGTDMALPLPDGGYTPDTTPPMLYQYTLDMDRDLLILTFNEPINPNSTSCNSITLYNSSDISASLSQLTLTGCVIEYSEEVAGFIMITLQLTREDITDIKENRFFATSAENVFLSLTSSSFMDTAGVEITPVSFAPVNTFIPDQTRPQLVSFTYDQNQGQIILSFNDILESSTFDATAITLQHDVFRSSGRTFTPSSNSTTSSFNGYVVVVDLSHFDLLRLKSNTGVARNENDTYITFAAFLIEDTSGLNVVPLTDGKAIPVETFIPDNEPPVLLNYTLDMDLGAIVLTFSDTVNLTTFNSSGLVIQEASNASETFSINVLRLTDGEASRSLDGLLVTLSLSPDDLNELKRNTNLTTSEEDTYLAVEMGTILDLAGNELVARSDAVALPPREFIPDTNSPYLVSFNLDMNSSTIFLTFNETVNAYSIDVSQIRLQNRRSDPTELYTISSEAEASTDNSTFVEVYLTKADVDSINRLRSLATGEFDTFISITDLAIADMNNNSVVAIANDSALSVTNFTRDMILPRLEAFDLDINAGVFTFHFSEVMDYVSFDPTQLTLLSSNNPFDTSATVYTLTGGSVRPSDDIVLYVEINITDLNEIKRLSELAVDENSTFISFDFNLVTDTFNNSVVNVSLADPQSVSRFTQDMTSPLIEVFTLDVDQGLLTLTFDETVNASTFTISAVTVQSSAVSPVQMYTLQTSTSSLNDSTVIDIYLSQRDLDAIKLYPLLATNDINTYLSLMNGLVEDMNRNIFQSVTRAGVHVADITAPELVDFLFDLNTGIIQLNFTEAVNTSSLDVSGLTLYASSDTNNSANSSYQLSIPSRTTDLNAKIFNVTLSEEDLNLIKADFTLAVDESTTFLTIDPYSILDMADNPVLPVSVPVQVLEFVPDITDPELEQATFDFNGGLLTLVFSETVNVDTFDPMEITLQNDMTSPPSSVNLQGGDFTMENSTTVLLTLTDYDLNLLKSLTNFFRNRMQAYVSITNATVQDMSGNYVVAISPAAAFMLDDVIPDQTPPEVLEFDLDLNVGLLTIRFSETISETSFDVTQLWIQNDESNFTEVHQLTGAAQTPSWNLTEVLVLLTFSDLNEIKLLEDLATDANNTFLRFTNTTAVDTAGNALSTLNETEGIAVAQFTPDTTPPTLREFYLDMNSPQLLTLVFSEPVRASSVEFSTITLQSVANISATNDSESYTLTNGTVLSENGVSIRIELAFIDAVSVQSMRSLAISEETTFISLEDATFLDMKNNPSVNISSEEAIQVSAGQYTVDTTEPSLKNFSIDLDSGLLALTFSEAMDVMSVGNGIFFLQREPIFSTDGVNALRFIGGLNVTNSDWYIINITLTFEQLNSLKLLAPNNVYIDNSTAFISIVATSLPTDTSGNDIVHIPEPDAIPVSEYIPDTTLPQVVDFQLNIEGTAAVATFEFSEPVLLASLVSTLIELHNSPLNDTSLRIVPLSGGVLNTTMNGLVLNLILTADDLNLLKQLTDIANSVDDTFIFFKSGSVTDVYGNDIDEQNGRTVQASLVLPDNTHPVLDAFSFDLDAGVLTLTFSETVNVSTINVTEIILQSHSNDSDFTYQLTGGVSSTINQPIVTISLTIEDLNAIKEIRGLATRFNNTFISVSPDTIVDMAGFNLTEVPEDGALGLLPAAFTQDTTRPLLLSFSLNLTSEELLLTFDETISVGDTVLGRITLQSGGENGTSVTLTPSSIVSVNDSTLVIIFLDTVDLNRIKLDTNLATVRDNTQLQITSGAVRDMANVANMEQVLNATQFYPDFVSPSLENYLFDLNSGLVLLNFDETVNATSVDISGLSFMDMPNGSVIFMLSDVINNSTNGPRLELYIIEDDLNAIKQNISLLTAMSNAYLALLPNFIADMNGNLLTPVAGVQAAIFLNDTTRPFLVRFDLNFDLGQLRLVFSETVNASSFDPTGITLQSTMNSVVGDDTQYTLTRGSLLSTVDDTELTLIIDVDDLNELKARGIAQNNFTTWLVLTDATVRDMSVFALPVLPLTSGINAANVDAYTEDMTGPMLLNFTLNLTSETLQLTFDETVDVFSINVTQFTLQNTSNESLLSAHILTDANFPVSVYSPMVTILLADQDLNEVKRLVDLGTSTDNTFLSFTELAIADRAGNPVIPRSTDDALRATAVFDDLRRPMLLEFEFDLDQGLLTLNFSETVQAGSVVLTDFALQNSRQFDNTTDISYYLTGGEVLSSDAPLIVIQLSEFDLNELKHIPALVSGADNVSSNSFLTLLSSAVRDSNGNSVFEIPSFNALEASVFVSDVTRPTLTGFDLDLNVGIMTLNFSEAVNGTTLNPTGITLHNINETNATSTYTLANGSVIEVTQTSVVLQLTNFDLDNIKAILDLATNTDNSFVTIDEAAILDTSDNPVVGVAPEEAIAVTDISTDATRPQLLGFNLDINSGSLTISFSETVLPSSVNPSAITVQSMESLELTTGNESLYFTLTSLENATSLSNTVLHLQMTNSDLNEVKARSRLATSEADSFLSLTERAITDVNGNAIVPVSSSNASSVSNYTEDSSPPELMSFNVDLNQGQIVFRFSETVNATTLDQPSFTLRDSCPTSINSTNTTSAINSTNTTNETTDFASYTLRGN